MHGWLVVEVAASIVARLTSLLMQLILAATVIAGGIVVGHELRDWRIWYHGLPAASDTPKDVPVVTEP